MEKQPNYLAWLEHQLTKANKDYKAIVKQDEKNQLKQWDTDRLDSDIINRRLEYGQKVLTLESALYAYKYFKAREKA